MSYRPDESELMAYLYDELEAEEKLKLEHYLMNNPQARQELEQLRQLRNVMATVKDKEVISPPIFLSDNRKRYWDAPYFKTIISIAASLTLLILAARFSDAQITFSSKEFKISFGRQNAVPTTAEVLPPTALTADQIQLMINESMQSNNNSIQARWEESQHKLDESIKQNLALNSNKIDQYVREASTASQAQIQQYVSNIQTDNLQMVKDYFKLTSTEQKQYIEDLLVDFAKYLQQQRQDDLQLVQTRLNNIEQRTNVFKQETEQILTSIISTVGNTSPKENQY